MSKKRADILIYEKNLVDSREKAKRLIMEGVVYVGENKVEKPGEFFLEDTEFIIKSNPLKYVSRGGLKLEKAIEEFNLNLNNKICMDIGASTGGFTDCMLQNNAKKVYAVDVGYGQLDWKLRNDNRVVVLERTNIRKIDKNMIKDKIDFISIDVSFISLELVLPVAKELLSNEGIIIALIKPQFEAGKNKVGKKGIIKDKNIHLETVMKIINFAKTLELYTSGFTYSPIKGMTGNIEFLIMLDRAKKEDNLDIEKIILDAHEKL
ncbi:MAG: TlyA family RNA methyltransferase [Tissierellales bacterium]|nr:TlyA family RNA methyltransferase [Tissierellales bacterium]